MVPLKLPTALIAAQSANRQFTFSGSDRTHQIQLSFSLGRLIFSFVDATDRVIYAALEN